MNQTKKNIRKDANSGSVWAVIFGLTVVTIYFNQNSEDPFNTPKLVMLMLTAGWLSGHIVHHYTKQKVVVGSQNFWTLSLCLIFLLSQIIALFYTDVFIVGLIGETQRRNGFLAYFALTIILLFASIRFNYFYTLRLIKSSVFIGLVLSCYGLLQITGNDFVKWNNPYNSMISTLGNPNFASALLAILTIIAILLLFIKSIQNVYKIAALVLMTTSFVAIYKSNSRQGLLVIIIGLLFYFSIYSYFNYRKLRSFIVFFAASFLGLLVAGMLQVGPFASYLYKSSVSVRGYYWKAAFAMFEEKPLMGVGLDRYGSYFKQFRDVGYPLNYGYEITSSNAHNVYLQLLSTGGVFVGLSYLLILLLVIVTGLKSVKHSGGDEQKAVLLLLSAWIGFQAQSLISIDNIGISIWGWVLGGAIIGLSINSNKKDVLIGVPPGQLKKVDSVSLFQPLVSVIVLVPTLFISVNLWNGESQMRLIRQYASSNITDNKQIVYSNAQKLFNSWWIDPFYKFQSSLYMVDAGYINESYKQIKALYENDPRNLEVLRWLADYSKSEGNYKNEILFRSEISVLDPWNANNFLMLGVAYKQMGDLASSKEMLKKIISFTPNSEIAKKALAELP